MLVGQRSAAAHSDQPGVTLSRQDRHESHPLLITRRSSSEALASLRRPIDGPFAGGRFARPRVQTLNVAGMGVSMICKPSRLQGMQQFDTTYARACPQIESL